MYNGVRQVPERLEESHEGHERPDESDEELDRQGEGREKPAAAAAAPSWARGLMPHERRRAPVLARMPTDPAHVSRILPGSVAFASVRPSP